MTTKEAAAVYKDEHIKKYRGRDFAVFNPQGKPVDDLPVIYGFNNGGSPGWMAAVLISEDGVCLGQHVCSDEAYMPHDLGCLEGTRPDRHETFREHYPNGYRMEFVGYDDIPQHQGLAAAFAAHVPSDRTSQEKQ